MVSDGVERLDGLDQRQAGALADGDEVTHRRRGRRLALGDVDELHRPRDLGPFGHADDETVGHESRVESHCGVRGNGIVKLQRGNHRRVARFQCLGQRENRQAGLKILEIGQFGPVATVGDDETACLVALHRWRGNQHTRHVAGTGGGRKRLQPGAQVGVFPVFDAAVRQAALVDAAKGGITDGDDVGRSGQRRPLGRVAGGKRLFCRRANGGGNHGHPPQAAASAT